MLEDKQRKKLSQLLCSISADDVQNAKKSMSELCDAAAGWRGQKALAAATGLGLLWDT